MDEPNIIQKSYVVDEPYIIQPFLSSYVVDEPYYHTVVMYWTSRISYRVVM